MGEDGCAEQAFTIVLFSVLDALLDVSMDEVLEFLPLDDAVADSSAVASERLNPCPSESPLAQAQRAGGRPRGHGQNASAGPVSASALPPAVKA